MMRFITLSFSRSFSTLRRDLFGTLGATLFLGLLFFLMFVLVFLGVAAQKTTDSLGKQVSLVFFFLPEAQDYQVTNMDAELRALQSSNKISDYRIVPKEEALQEFVRRYPEKTVFLDRYNLGNPLRASFEITPKDMSIGELGQFFENDRFTGIIDKTLISENGKERERAQKVLNALDSFQIGIFILSGIFLFAILIVISTAITHSLFLARREIFIMHLVGATPSFIRTPFLIESFLITGTGILVGFALFWWGGMNILLGHFMSIADTHDAQIAFAKIFNEMFQGFFALFPWIVAFGFLATMGASFFTIGQYLRKKNLLREFA